MAITIIFACANISIASSLAVLVTIYAFKNLRSKSSHFIMALAISDILFSATTYINYLPNLDTNISLCRFEAWSLTAANLSQEFVSVLLVDHLSRILRLQKVPFRSKDLWLLVFALYVFAGILASIPIITDDYEFLPEHYCWIPQNTPFRAYFRFFILYGIVWICIIYSTIRMAQVFRHHNEKKKQMKKKPLALAFQNPVLQESFSVKHSVTITVDSHHQSAKPQPKSPSLMSRLSSRLFGSSTAQKQDNLTTEDRMMLVIKTLLWYPVVDIICWLPFAVVRAIQFIQYVEGSPALLIHNLMWNVLLGNLNLMGLGHAIIFFLNKKVRRTLKEYVSKTIFQEKIDPQTNVKPHAHFRIRNETVELTSV